MATGGTTKKFINYPVPKKGPDVPYKNDRKENPAVKGLLLIAGAFLMEWLGFVRYIIWRNAGFSNLRAIRTQIEDYEPRFDPTVIVLDSPTSDSSDGATDLSVSKENADVERLSKLRYSVSDYHEMYLKGELTPTAVAKALLPLIRRDLNPPGEYSIGWFDTDVAMVLKAAEASTLRYKNQCPIGPLDGVPTAIKDEYDMEGYRTTLGSKNDYTGKDVPGDKITSWCVRKMEDAGAIILGKLSMHEFGLDTSGNNPNYGTPPNPYNTKYYTGGSSSGCGYAVSSGLIPIALGGDGGGSIRIPASFCGVYGLKPTHGRLAFEPSANHSNTCAVNGPLAADISSLAAFYHVIAQPHPSSHFAAPSPFNISASRPKVLGIPEEWFARATPLVQGRCRSLLDKLVAEHDYKLVPIKIPFLVEAQIAHALTMLTDAATLLPKTHGLTPANKILIALGTVTPSTDYLLAQKLRRCLMEHLAYLWAEHPGMVIVTPTTACEGWPVGSKIEMKFGVSDGDRTLKTMEYVWMANFLGLPSVTVPAGFVPADKKVSDRSEIPVGLMGMAEWGEEDLLLHWGMHAERVGSARVQRPGIWIDVVERARKEMGTSP
ncbi:hypothetical protein BP6252_07832 [Coleophoma cylindrospora]|uniref:Amidase domain-containing protein n=1 Tax=Coleophoma cylindrospora TaxID=1849047 RepID=A0A3D8RB33_9HELO|nr:hypothetical protein BP6252_07832 [Coleophoma cylindrospora]